MRKLLITPALDKQSDFLKDKLTKLLVFMKSRDTITIFDIISGNEEELSASRVLEYKDHLLLDGRKYHILERMNHE